jgi:predicted nucleotidyltransferase
MGAHSEGVAVDVRELVQSKREEILRIARAHGARNVRVFGSAARGEADETSDVDFLVEFEPGTSLLQHGAMIAELEELLGRRVDVAPEKTLREHLRERVLREAVPL